MFRGRPYPQGIFENLWVNRFTLVEIFFIEARMLDSAKLSNILDGS